MQQQFSQHGTGIAVPSAHCLSSIRPSVFRYHDRMEHVLGETRGYLQTALDFPTSVALASTIKSHHEHGWGSCVRIGTERDTEVCNSCAAESSCLRIIPRAA